MIGRRVKVGLTPRLALQRPWDGVGVERPVKSRDVRNENIVVQSYNFGMPQSDEVKVRFRYCPTPIKTDAYGLSTIGLANVFLKGCPVVGNQLCKVELGYGVDDGMVAPPSLLLGTTEHFRYGLRIILLESGPRCAYR